MKSIKLLLIGLAAAFALAGCSESNGGTDPDPDPTPEGKGSVVGEWHMISWSTLTAADIYISFNKSGSFELYQRLYTPEYVHLNGTYSYNEPALSGMYSDNVPWGNSYNVSFNSDGTQMTLTSTTSANDVSVFVKEKIPSEIISAQAAASSVQSRQSEDTPRFL